MKYTIKGRLADNTVTVDNLEDKILQIEKAGNTALEDVIDEMKNEDTGLRRETIEHVVDLYHRIVERLLLSGYNVNTGLFYFSPLLFYRFSLPSEIALSLRNCKRQVI